MKLAAAFVAGYFAASCALVAWSMIHAGEEQ